MIPIYASADAAAIDCAACADPRDFAFDFAFQPIVDVRQQRIVAHEALVRGPAGEPAATVLAQVTPATVYSFDQLCRIRAVEAAARLQMREVLSINFLANAVRDPRHCIRSTFAAARAYDFPVERIQFEVVGGERVEDSGHLLEIFNAYREYGFHTAIDDFGAGFAGLNLLATFQPDVVKIDMALVRGIEHSTPRQVIVRALAAMCRQLGVRLLAKGVETAPERDFLVSEGIDLMQGYLFARPAFRALATVAPARWG